jgi:hypothetical protein
MDGWKEMSTRHYNSSCKLVALELHNNFSCTITTSLHLDMVPHIWVVSIAIHATCPITFMS